MAANPKRVHVATRIEGEKPAREDRDLRRPLRDGEVEELLAVAAQADEGQRLEIETAASMNGRAG